jgi:hypothetical protein
MLRGMGTAVALPWLEAMTPSVRGADVASKNQPLRSVFLFTPNGMHMPDWYPKGEGSDYKLSPTLQGIEGVRDDVLILSGLAHNNARAHGDGGGDHARSSAAYLTGVHPVKTAGADFRLGVSIDQVLAREIGGATRLPSLEIGCESRRSAGNCDSGYSCVYTDNISWSGATTPVAKEVDPRAVFERLFGSDDELQSRESRARRAHYRKSILDYVADDTRSLQKQLGRSDQHKLGEYLEAVRSIERRMEKTETNMPTAGVPIEKPKVFPYRYTDHLRIMNDLLVVSLQMDITRVASFMYGVAGSNRSFNHIGVAGGHHELSHHRGDQAKIDALKKIDRFHMQEVGRFLAKLKSVKEGNSSLLDNCAIVLGGGLGDGNRHRHENLPILIAGRAGGRLKPGRHVRYKTEVPLTNLFLSMLNFHGVKADRFGDSSGHLGQLS